MSTLTSQHVESVLSRLSPSDATYVALTLLAIQDIPFDHTLTISGGKLQCESSTFDLPSTLKHLPDGPVFKDANGNPFDSKMKMARYINPFITKELNDPKATTSKIRALYATPVMTHKVDHNNLVLVKKTELKLDQDVRQNLKPYKFYVEQTGDEKRFYPFMLVKLAPYDIYTRYDVYRYVGQLPQSPRIGESLRLPTVDHINRDSRDNRRCSLRYVTAKQNLANQCTKDMKQPYHGVDTKSSCHTQTMDPDVANKVVYWVNIISQLLPTLPDKEVPKTLLVFSPYPCRNFSEFSGKLYYLDPLVNELIEMLSTEDKTPHVAYTTPTFNIAHHDAVSYPPLIKHMLSRVPITSFKIMKTIRPDYVCALVNDITRYILHQEYSHTNYLRAPKPRTTLANIIKKLIDPVELLNFYEQFIDPNTLEALLIACGVPPDDAKGKKRHYAASGSHIIATLVPRTEHAGLHSNFIVLDSIKMDTMITTPRTLYTLG